MNGVINNTGLHGRCAGIAASLGLAATIVACGSDTDRSVKDEAAQVADARADADAGARDAADASGEGSDGEPLYATSTVVFGDDGETTYIKFLSSLDTQTVDLDDAREMPGWSDISTRNGHLFISEGEAPTLRRYAISAEGELDEAGSLSFLDHGAAYASGPIVADDKAYVIAEDGVIWDPKAFEITGTFALPEVDDRSGGHEYSGIGMGRATVVRGNRMFVATNWANWDEYTMTDDSLIVVFDTDEDRVIDLLPVDCPYLDVATLADDGAIYFSNWVYSVGQTLLRDAPKACAARILPGEETIDADWSLTFADVVDGREAAAMGYIGEQKAIVSVFHDEMVETNEATDLAELINAPNWRSWILDLETREAEPLEGVDFHSGGFTATRVDDRTFILVPSGDYASTTFYEVHTDGSVEERWTVKGWSMTLIRVR